MGHKRSKPECDIGVSTFMSLSLESLLVTWSWDLVYRSGVGILRVTPLKIILGLLTVAALPRRASQHKLLYKLL